MIDGAPCGFFTARGRSRKCGDVWPGSLLDIGAGLGNEWLTWFTIPGTVKCTICQISEHFNWTMVKLKQKVTTKIKKISITNMVSKQNLNIFYICTNKKVGYKLVKIRNQFHGATILNNIHKLWYKHAYLEYECLSLIKSKLFELMSLMRTKRISCN